ncbi:glycosyltransferase family 4 protein [Endozoicomonas ascidiicola]|uniref:glycosyltransferase family 4 protein n=1 Tax=Endozoicomonas ascidiicola TaxID=1698521 RepID=UPI000834C627|nr:glycosyltransferase family 4 protein [Endozoicomonas ascidiicola]
MTIYVFYNNDPLASDQGGGAEHLRGIYRALKENNLDYQIIAAAMPRQTDAKDNRVTYIATGPNILKFMIAMLAWFINNRKQLTSKDVFHFHRNYCIWPKVLTIGDRGRSIITYHNQTGKKLNDWFGEKTANMIRFLMLIMERKAVSHCDRIIFVSDRVRQALKESVLRENYGKTVVIPAAFDAAAFKDPKPASKDVTKKIVSIGRLSKIKNFDLGIETLEKLNEQGLGYHLTIIGDGELRTELEQRRSKSQFSEDITLYGLAQHSEIKHIIEASGIVLVSSVSEASPTVVKEGIASLRPVVTTDVGDVGMWIKNGKNGFICEHNSESISQAIIKATQLLENNQYEQSVDLASFSEKEIMKKVIAQYQ